MSALLRFAHRSLARPGSESRSCFPIREILVTVAWRSYLLGAFICFEIVYLSAANLVKMFPARGLPPDDGEIRDDILQARFDPGSTVREPAQTLIDITAYATERWAEVSGQNQSWSLFAPDFPHQAVFAEVELWWGDRKVTLLSPRLPATPDRYLMWPDTRARVLNYESRIVLVYWRHSPKDFAARPDYWRQKVTTRVHHMNASTAAYLAWRVREYLESHSGETMPDEARLLVRTVPSRNPARGSDAGKRPPQYVIPLARWKTNGPTDPKMLPVEAWDLATQMYVTLPKDGAP